MVDIKDITKQFKEKVCKEIEITQEGINRYFISTPFSFEDGDSLVIILKKENNAWILTDEAHTFMHMSYFMDIEVLNDGKRKGIIDGITSMYSVENRDGELVLTIPNSEYGDALFSFVEALIKITDTSYLSRDMVASTFMEDFAKLLSDAVPPENIHFDWYDARDTQKAYQVDCRIETKKQPIFIFALDSDRKIMRATIALQHFKLTKIEFEAIGIYESQQDITDRRAIAAISDVIDKQFSAIEGNKDNIKEYVHNKFIKNS